MNTERLKRGQKERLISLNASETLALTKPEAWTDVVIIVDSGILRIGTNSNGTLDDTTLAFACRTEPCIFIYPDELSIKLESISDSSFSIKYNREGKQNGVNSIVDWVLHFHMIRRETNINSRLYKLFELLTTKLGKRTTEGYLLEHTLSHARIAELVGSTRSTVSRGISNLRKSELIYIDDLKNQLIIPAD